MRYRLLETVRQYGLERLAEAGEEEARAHPPPRSFPRPRRRSGVRSSRPAASASGSTSSTPRRPTWRPRSTTRCGANHRSPCASAWRSVGGGVRAVAPQKPSWRTRARWTPAGTASRRCAHAPPRAAPTSPSGWATSRRRRRTRPRRWRSRRRSGTRGRLRWRARDIGSAMAFTDPSAARGELARAADLARAAGDDRALLLSKQAMVLDLPVPKRTRPGQPRQRGGGRAG